jgi:hypothetical protein
MDLKSTRKQSNNDRFTKEKNIFYIHFALILCATFNTASSAAPPQDQISKDAGMGSRTVAA